MSYDAPNDLCKDREEIEEGLISKDKPASFYLFLVTTSNLLKVTN